MFNLFKSKKKKDMYEDINTAHYSVDPWRSYDSYISREDYFKMWVDYPATKSSSWLKRMPPNYNLTTHEGKADVNANFARVTSDYIDTCIASNLPYQDTHVQQSTIKGCPSIVELLKQSIVVKAPMDIHVCVSHHVGDPEPVVHIHSADLDFKFTQEESGTHKQIQFTCKNSDLFKDMVNLKLDCGIAIHMHKDVTLSFMQPIFHNHPVPWQVIPGIFTDPLNGYANLIFNSFLPINTEDFIIKKGTALFYATFSKKVELLPTDKANNMIFKKTMYMGHTTIRKELGK